jgi:hypothetical protein
MPPARLLWPASGAQIVSQPKPCKVHAYGMVNTINWSVTPPEPGFSEPAAT